MARYAAKRDFARTPEPRGGTTKSGGNAYIIQKHAATRLHYDFRLELDGVLKSWAVTKGPSLDPADRRLAVHVEDHPLAYGGFEGVIPQGQYGGGTVMVWDRGTWEPVGDPRAAYAAGRLKFVLKGKRLKGSWLLVRMRGRAAQEGRDNWLLIKENDRHARAGHGDALTTQTSKSVISGKTMEQIADSRNAKVGPSKASAKAGTRRRAAATAGPRPQVSAKPAWRSKNSQHLVAGVAISHPDREIFPGVGITKEGLAEYYRAVADWILPEIADRPLSLLRCPTGINGQCFFQKHFTTGMKSVDRIAIREKSGSAEYLVVRDAHDLVALIQEGIIEIHPWGARADDPDKPDRMIFDLDPAPNVAFERVIEATVAMRDLLAEFDLETFAKTTGGKGLHVVVPLRRGIGWKELKSFTHAIAETFARADSARFTTTPAKQSRSGKIFIDYLRNDRGSTAVAGYCARARAGAPVAMPLAWSEVRRGLDPHKYSVATVPRVLAKRRDPWRALYRSRQIIPARSFKTLGID